MEDRQDGRSEAAPFAIEVDDRLRRVVDAIPALVLTAWPDDSVDFIAQSWLEYTGRNSEALRDPGWRAALAGSDEAMRWFHRVEAP